MSDIQECRTAVLSPDLPLISCVTVPGVVRGSSGKSVIEALGGESVLARSLGNAAINPGSGPKFVNGCWQRNASEDASTVFLRLDPQDRYSKFLTGTGTPRSDLLVKIRRKKNGPEKGRIINFTAVGLVVERVTFNSLADFICLPPPSVARSIRLNLDDELGGTKPLFMPPPAFSRISQPFPYKYSANPLIPAPGTSAFTRRRRTDEPLFNVTARFNDPNVPKEPLEAAKDASVDPQILVALKALFDQKPIWLRTALLAALKVKATPWRLKPVMAQTCFLFTDGPWRGALCSFNYDPRKDPAARVYQTIDFRDPFFRTASWRSSVRLEDKTPEREEKERHFEVPPSRYSKVFQLCEIRDPGVQRLLSEATPTKTCSKESGWFSPETMESVRMMMLMRSREMRQQEKLATCQIIQSAEQ